MSDALERHRSDRRAVVIGASMAGLCAARVLTDRFDEVCVLDRDRFPTEPGTPRDHVPQGRHPHVLLVSGARVLERWFPDLLAELYAAGAVSLDVCADFYWHQCGAALRRPTTDLVGPSMSRPLLETTVRRRLCQRSEVEIRSDCAATGLEVEGERVTGVLLSDGTRVSADLIVDATGRQARTLPWLEAAGFPAPPVEVIGVDTRYVTQTYRRAPSSGRDWAAAAVVDEPSTRRMAMALPIEGDRWLVVLAGLNGEVPPTDEGKRLAWANSLPSPVISDLIATSEALGQPATYRFAANQRRRVDKLRRFPVGWLLLGDAVCSFDPIYGQGMTSAALQAEVLASCLDRCEIDRRLGRRYFGQVSSVVAGPWSIAAGGDFAYPGTTGRKPGGTNLVNRYMERVMVAAQRDDHVALRFNEVAAMVRRPHALLTPMFVARVLRRSRRRKTSPNTLGPRPFTAAQVPRPAGRTPARRW